MKRIIFLTIALGLCLSAIGQNFTQNLQKYWWYRYRLVNDFMKVGTNHGESVPGERIEEDDQNSVLGYPRLEMGDATQKLGHYLGVLALEYKFLDQNGLSTDRTVYELWCALEALDRLDREAEEHCRNFAATQDDQNINPHLSGNDVYSNDFNGFFIRDDMPKSFVQDNLSHFSRPGNCSPVICCNGSIIGRRTDVMGATWSSQHPNVPWYPTEMSIDQVSELYKGLALVVKFLPSNVQYSGTSIKTKAQDAILRIT